MDEQKKPFGAVDIVLLCIIAGASDLADLFTDLALPIPVIGQVAYFLNMLLISPAVWATIQLWFIIKVGFGAPGLVTVAGGILNVVGVSGSQTASTLVAIYLANHPKVAKVAALATGAKAIGATAGAATAESATVLEGAAGEGAAAGSALAGETGAAAGVGAEVAGSARGGEVGVATQGPNISEEALGERRSIFEEMKEPMETILQEQIPKKEDENEDVVLRNDVVDLKNAA